MSNEWGSIDTTVQVSFLKLEEASTQLRIASKPYAVSIHWEEDRNGARKKVVCSSDGCPLCQLKQKEHMPLARFYARVINRKDGQVYVFEFGKVIASAIKKYALSLEYGDPKMYDIKIDKKGSGRDSKYMVMASKSKSPITELENQELEQIDMDQLVEPTSIEDIKKMELKALPIEVMPPEFPNDEIGDSDWDSIGVKDI